MLLLRYVLLLGLMLLTDGRQARADAAPASIVGTVSLSLPQRGERPARYYRGSYRASHGSTPTPAPVQSVVVYVEGLTAPAGGWPLPDDPALMRQHHDRFVPHVLPVLRGRTVSFPNDDNYFHNVFSVVAGDRFDLGRYGQGKTRLQTFEDPAVVVVRCEIHASMKAYILVQDSPHFVVPDRDGQYRLESVPAGTWTVVAWHPARGAIRRTVTVHPDKPTRLDLTF